MLTEKSVERLEKAVPKEVPEELIAEMTKLIQNARNRHQRRLLVSALRVAARQLTKPKPTRNEGESDESWERRRKHDANLRKRARERLRAAGGVVG